MAKLVVQTGRNAGAEHKLNAERLILGRRSACPIPILDTKASREHAVVIRKGDQFFLQDLSRNGTTLNGQPASKNGDGPSPMKFGDKIQIGDTILELVDEKAEAIPIEIPGYKIMEKIGSGGMGTVYKAKQLSMDRIVALKVLNEKYSANREFVDRFIREARAAGKLNHPNVIHVHDVSKSGGRHYFSMEYVDGNSVKETLRIQTKMDANLALDIALQTAKALEFAHENGIVHRDIKPDNIMLTKDAVVKIADLGIAKNFEEAPGSITSEQRRVLGTPHYMAPEQALGKDIDHRVDIYALGATLYHMLTGTTPFSGSTAHQVLKAHIQESLPPIQEFSPAVPDAVCFIVERMMAKLPEKRYPNMTRLIEDLEKSQKGLAEGIERIEAGDSTILRAVGAKEAAHLAKQRKKTTGTGEVSTGIQTPVRRVLLYVGLAAAFLVVVAVVVFALRPAQETTQLPPPASPPAPPAPPASPVPPPAPTYPEVDAKLGEAKGLLASDPESAKAEALLHELVVNYPTLKNREEIDKLLEGIRNVRKEIERKKVQEAFDAARRFENEHVNEPAKFAEIAQKFKDVLTIAQPVPALFAETKNKAEFWEARQRAEAAKSVEASWKQVLADSDEALTQLDYDGARKGVQEFIEKNAACALKTDAESKLKAVDENADQRFTKTQELALQKEKDSAHPLPAALAVWDEYLKKVKDTRHRTAAEEARKDVQTLADKVAEGERTKAADLAKKFDYDGALKTIRLIQDRLAGIPGIEVDKTRERELILQRDLHDKVVKAIARRGSAEPAVLPNFQIPKFPAVKDWIITGATWDKINLDAVPKNSAPQFLRRFSELSTNDLYQVYKLYLPSPTADDHKALAAFCKERGMEEAAAHAEKATTKDP